MIPPCASYRGPYYFVLIFWSPPRATLLSTAHEAQSQFCSENVFKAEDKLPPPFRSRIKLALAPSIRTTVAGNTETTTALKARAMKESERHHRCCPLQLQLPLCFLILYVLALVLYLHIVGSFVNPSWRIGSSHGVPQNRTETLEETRLGYALFNVTPAVAAQQRVLCQYRSEAARSIMMHMHIPKSGGTAFAMALKSECRCADIPRPRKGYCKECPHVLPDKEMPVSKYTQNLWTAKNMSFDQPFDTSCRTYQSSSRWFGFPTRNRTYSYYTQNRLTSGWPCGVHAGYARLRECLHRLQLPGIKHVVVTLFREPLARFVSEYYQVAYNRRVINSWDWCMNRTTPLSLTEFLAMPISFPFHSRTAKLLSGSPIQTGAAGENWGPRDVRQRALVRALSVVTSSEDFMFGLAEELDLTLEMLQFVFKRNFEAPSHCHSHQNKTGCRKVELGLHDIFGKPLNLSVEEKHLFDKNNYADKAVYDMAKRVFWDRIEAMKSLQALGSDFAIDRRCSSILNGE